MQPSLLAGVAAARIARGAAAALLRAASAVPAPWPSQLQQQQQQRALHLAPPFLVDEPYTPVAVTTWRLGRLPAKLEAARAELAACRACPRNCGVNRLQDEQGLCFVGRKALVNVVAPHFAEEAPVKGWAGSGTVFFSGCNLRCVFCQNWDISQKRAGFWHRTPGAAGGARACCRWRRAARSGTAPAQAQAPAPAPASVRVLAPARAGFEMSGPELADWMLKLQEAGCHNINFVTPEHVAPQVAEAIACAVERGLCLPIVYNTSGYDSLASLRLMDGLVDIYLPDFKFFTDAAAARYAKARDYPVVAREAIAEMHRQVGDLCFTPDGLAKRGVLLRHLVMPGQADEARAILAWVAEALGRDTFVHIMEQYSPRYLVEAGGERRSRGWDSYDPINTRPADSEVDELRAFARSLGLWRFEEAAAWESGELAG